jgi:stage II sporulation protein P
VLHNGTVHDTNHNAAYSASLKTVMQYTKSYPSLKLFFDIHRDGLSSDKPKLRVTTTINKKTVAQVMFVVGVGTNSLKNPHWQENLKFAMHLQQVLNEKYPGLAKPIYVREGRFNQHISSDSLIIEIGGDGNLLSECVDSTKYVAWAINEVIKK